MSRWGKMLDKRLSEMLGLGERLSMRLDERSCESLGEESC